MKELIRCLFPFKSNPYHTQFFSTQGLQSAGGFILDRVGKPCLSGSAYPKPYSGAGKTGDSQALFLWCFEESISLLWKAYSNRQRKTGLHSLVSNRKAEVERWTEKKVGYLELHISSGHSHDHASQGYTLNHITRYLAVTNLKMARPLIVPNQ